MKLEDMSTEQRLTFMENKIKILEDENVETTNALYEIENRMQSQIDALINYTMQLKSELKHWGEPNDIY